MYVDILFLWEDSMVRVEKILINSFGKFIILDDFLLLLLKLYFMH